MKKMPMGVGRLLIFSVGGIVLILLVSALSNLGLPEHSQTVETLSAVEKARIAEYLHLRDTLADEVWWGWGAKDVPVIVHNEAYVFLVGYQGDPPPGWVMVPAGKKRGGSWGLTPGDDFFGQPYYRQQLPDSGKTPENFTVQVGDTWAATMMTREYARIRMAKDLQEEFPPGIRTVVPYRLVWKVLLGATETYLGGLCHESFHAYQGRTVPERFANAESVHARGDSYPWDDDRYQSAWKEEGDLLVRAIHAPSLEETAELVGAFLNTRAERRQEHQLSPALIEYERKMEWLEGLAKYAELEIQRKAGGDPTYQPVSSIQGDPDFSGYQDRDRYWKQQVSEIGRAAGRAGETRFYYTGFAQGVLLDRLLSDWKTRLWAENVWLDELLREAIQ